MAAVVDPSFHYVSLLLDGEEAVGSTQAIDRSLHKLTPSAVPSGLVVESETRLGRRTYKATSGFLSYSTPGDCQALYVGAQDFTLEASLWFTNYNIETNLFTLAMTEAAGRTNFFVRTNRTFGMNRYGANLQVFSGSFLAPVQSWFDVAIVRRGTVIECWVDGVLIGTVGGDSLGAFSASTVISNGTGGMTLGGGAAGWKFANVRVTRGKARTIAPQTAPYDKGYKPAVYTSRFQGVLAQVSPYEEIENFPMVAMGTAAQTFLTLDASYHGRTSGLSTSAAVTGWRIDNYSLTRFDAADFTISIQAMRGESAIDTRDSLISCWRDSPLSGWRLSIGSDLKASFSCAATDGKAYTTVILRAVPTYWRWGLFTVSRRGAYIWLHWEGIPVGVLMLPNTGLRLKDATGPLYIANEQASTWVWGGYFDSFEIKEGVGDYEAQWPAVPDAPYPQSYATDLHFNDVSLLLADSLTDKSPRTKSVNNFGLTVSSAVQKFDKSMIRITSGMYGFISSNEFAFGEGDFTVEFDYYHQNTATGNNGLLCSRSGYGDAGWVIDAYPGSLVFIAAVGLDGVSLDVPAGVMVHVAFQRVNNGMLAFLDGKLMSSVSWGSSPNISYANGLYIGKLGWMPAVGNAYIGNLRITRWRPRVFPVNQYVPPVPALGKKWARLDPYDRSAASPAALSNSDLTYVGKSAVRATVGARTGKWYWEVSSTGANYPIVGVGTSSASVEASLSYPGNTDQSWAYHGFLSQKIFNEVYTNYGFTWNGSDQVVGVALDMDAGTLTFYKGGASMGVAFTGLPTGQKLHPMVGGYTNGANSNATFNFGQTPFKHTPPAGYSAGLWESEVTDVPQYVSSDSRIDSSQLLITGEGNLAEPVRHTDNAKVHPISSGSIGHYRTRKMVKSGAGSVYLSTAGAALSFPSSAHLNMNVERWTWRAWVFEPAGSLGSIVCRRTGATNGWVWTTSSMRGIVNGGWQEPVFSWSRPTVGVWHHHQLMKMGTTLYAFVDGKLQATKTGVNSLHDEATILMFGAASAGGENRSELYLADVEFIHAATSAEDFVPPVRANTQVIPNFAAAPDLLLWLDASDAGSLSIEDDRVVSWLDKVTGAVAFSQSTAAQRPQINRSLLRLPCVDFGKDGVSRSLQNAVGVKVPRQHTVFVVGYWNDRNDTYAALALQSGVTGTAIQGLTGTPFCIVHTANNSTARLCAYHSNGNFYGNFVVAKGSSFIAEFVIDSTPQLSKLLANNNDGKSAVAGTRMDESVVYRSLGSTDSAYLPNGAIAEVQIYEGVLDTARRNEIRKALSTKWEQLWLDEHWTSVALSLTGEGGLEGGTSWKDNSINSAAITRFGTTCYYTRTKRLHGDSSIVIPGGTTGRLQVPNDAKYRAASMPWTLEMAIWCSSYSANKVLFDANNDSSNTTGFQWYVGNNGRLYVWQGTTGTNLDSGTAQQLTAGVWQRVALSWDGTTLRFFIEGNLVGEATSGFTNVWSTAAGFSILADKWSAQALGGNMANFRFTRGVCRYSANYTPLNRSFPIVG